jgi:hypothetical protein
MSILSSIVILDLIFFIPQIKKEITLISKAFSNIIFASSYLIPLIYYYFIVFKDEKYLMIIERYSNEPKQINLVGKTLVSIFIIVLLSLIFVLKSYFI